MPVSGMALGMYDPEQKVAKLLSFIWPSKWQTPPETIPLSDELGNWVHKNWTGEPEVKIINDPDKEEPEATAMLSRVFPKESSLIVMDLELEDERLGSLMLFVEGQNRYTKVHTHLLSLLHEPFAIAISNILQYHEIILLKDILQDDNQYLQNQLIEVSGDKIIGADFGLNNVMEMVRQVAALNSPVLLLGETGVGKEVIANAVHYSSQRKDNPFIKVNCGAIPTSLVDSELFGHEKGAFTGAVSKKRGRFERADTGTIFLDEIGELPMEAQVRLLHVLQKNEIERVGGTEVIPLNES